MSRRSFIRSFLCAGIVVVGSLAEATQIRYQTPQELGAQSSLVVTGRVSSVRSYWNESRTKIFTETTVNVGETFKGSAGGSVGIIQLGGVVGNVRVTVAGALQWRVDEEVLLFLEPGSGGAHSVSGFSLGKFIVERDQRTGEAFIRRPALEGVEILGSSSQSELTRTGRVETVPLQEFVDEALGGKK